MTVSTEMFKIVHVKATVDIQDALLQRAKRLALESGSTLGAVLEEGIRYMLERSERVEPYRMLDRSVGDPADADPLAQLSWHELRDEIYGRGELPRR